MHTRRLPHIYPANRWLFLTWHLHGSVPPARFPPPHATAGEAFVWIDRYLDSTRKGPMYLKIEEVAEIVVQSLHKGVQLNHYVLGPWVIMANHVHVLLLPQIPPTQLLKSLKGSTAREANRVLKRTGEHFWQNESYDRWVRDEEEWNRIAAYIMNNPVKAGFANRPQDYRWSSLYDSPPSVGTSADAARKSACATAP
jgi:REP element-mobilizing transposase RayT